MVITAAGESLVPEVRERAEAAFGTRVWNDYSASEAGVIAFECERGRLHLNADWYILESVDEDHRPVLPGQPSQTVLLTQSSQQGTADNPLQAGR